MSDPREDAIQAMIEMLTGTANGGGYRKFKNTSFGGRALAGARDGTGGIANPDGTRSSVRTGTWDISGPNGRTDVMVAPTIRQNPLTGELMRLLQQEAARIAMQTGDYVRVRGGKTPKKIEKARKKGDKRSQRFSGKLGNISARRGI